MTKLLELMNPGRWLLMLAAVLALTLGYYAWADHQRDIGYERARTEYATQAKAVDGRRANVALPIVAKHDADQVRIRTVFKTILKEVPVYVKATDCPMPGGFRVFHDAAADGILPNPADIADAAAVPADQVAGTVADNYGTCRENARRLEGLQEWVRAQQALSGKP